MARTAGTARLGRLGYIPFWCTYVFLYTPIIVLVVMSFNAGRSPYGFDGLSLKWYGRLAGNDLVLHGLGNTLIVAAGTTALSTVLGTMLAVGLSRFVRSRLLDALSLLPAVRKAEPATLIVADGTSCRHQIKDGTNRAALHVARVLAMSLDSARPNH